MAELAALLWPDAGELREEYAALLADPECAVFLWEAEGRASAFAHVQLRHDYVEGTKTSPVGYLEGISVRIRRKGRKKGRGPRRGGRVLNTSASAV